MRPAAFWSLLDPWDSEFESENMNIALECYPRSSSYFVYWDLVCCQWHNLHHFYRLFLVPKPLKGKKTVFCTIVVFLLTDRISNLLPKVTLWNDIHLTVPIIKTAPQVLIFAIQSESHLNKNLQVQSFLRKVKAYSNLGYCQQLFLNLLSLLLLVWDSSSGALNMEGNEHDLKSEICISLLPLKETNETKSVLAFERIEPIPNSIRIFWIKDIIVWLKQNYTAC